MKSSAYDIKPATSVLDPSLKIETCLEHPGEPNVYFCIDCNSLCCAYCILVGNHTRHSYTTRENAPQFISSTLRKAFSDIYYRFREGTREFESLTTTTQSKLVLLEKDLSAVEEKMAELSEQRICLRNRLSSICSDAHEEHRHFADHFRAILAETKHCYEVCRAQDAQVWNPTASVYADIASLLSQIDRYHKHVVSEANRLEVRKGLTVEMIKRSAPTTLPRHNVTEFQYPIPCHHESYKIASLEERSKNACDDKRETKDSRYDDVMDYVSSRFRSKVPVQNPTLCSNHDSISPERRTVVPGTGQTQTNPCSVVSGNSSPQDTPSNTSPSFPMRSGGGKQDNFARRSRSTEEGRKLRDAVRTPVDSQVRKEFLESSTQKKEKKVQNRQHTPPNRVPGEILATPQRKVKKNSGPTVQQYQRLVSCLWDASHVRSSNTQKAILSAIAFMKDEAEKWKAHDVLDKINRDKDIVRAIRKLSPHPQSESADHMPVHTRR